MTIPLETKKGTNQFVKQGHTASAYGTDPAVEAKGVAGKEPKDLS